jgi:pyruvate,water dikinase
MRAYVLGFQEVDRTDIAVVGGKGANLAELSRLEGIRVPDGFCVSTEAFKRVMGEAPAIGDLLDRLALLKAEDREAIRELAAAIRAVIEGIAIPEDLQEAITRFLAKLGEQEAYAVRSSATAEDLPAASFAGQQDTYLNVIGTLAILKHISRCWASLFTERAVAYRLQHGFDHRKVHMAVVVQKMLFPQAAGILFTADPITANRKVTAIEAGFGLGEALVSGLVNADGYKVREGQIIDKAIRQDRPVLTDEQIVRLARLGRQIEGHFR